MTPRVPLVPLLAALLVAAWIGAIALFGGAVAPAAFAVLPERAMAGALVGRVLPVLYVAGVAVGVAVATAGWRVGGRARLVCLAAGSLTALACAYSHVVIGGRIDLIRTSLPGAIDELDPGDPRRVTFGRLHGLSVTCLGLAAASAAVGAVVLLRAVGTSTRA